jgi:4-carboxymuconolactone decarboxylase
MAAPRIPPLREPEWDARVRELLGPWRIDTPAGPYVPNIFTTLARNPDLLAAWEPFAGEILLRGALAARDRELLVLRTAWNCSASYVWGQHAGNHGPAAGLEEAEIARVADGPGALGWGDWDATLLRAADELHATATIAEGTWGELAQRYGDRELIELTMLVGQYHLMAFALNALGVQDEAGAARLPVQPD